MKKTVIFVTGAIFGAVCLYAWQSYQFHRIAMSATLSPISHEDILNRKSFLVDYGSPLRLEQLATGEQFTLTLTQAGNGRARYSWQAHSPKEEEGSGELFEKYEHVASTPTGMHVKDAGGSLFIRLKDDLLEWSMASDSSGYIYYNSNSISITYQTKD